MRIQNNIHKHRVSAIYFLLMLFLVVSTETFAYNQTYEVNIGDQFTVYTTYKSGTYAVLWDYDWSIVQPVSYIGDASTSVTFKAIAASPSIGSIITATTYYMKSGTTSSGANKYFEDWRVIVADNSTVRLNTGNLSMTPGDYEYVNAIVSNSKYSGSYKWTTSNSNVAYVVGNTGNVRIYASGPGSATITVTLDNGSSANCYVNVLNVEPTNIGISSSLNAYVGEYTRVNRTITPSNAVTTLSWYSSNQNILTVNSSGEVYGISEGEATVYARTSNGLISNNCNVIVKYRKPTDVSLNKDMLYLPIGQQSQLIATITPGNAKYTLEWKSENFDIVEISSSGVVVAKNPGTTKVSVKTDNGCTDVCTITVPSNPTAIYLPNKISILYGNKRKLTVTSNPIDAYKYVEWSSSAPDIVSVAADGTITAHKAGSATIKAVSSNGLVANCLVEVEAPVFNFLVWTHGGEKVIYNFEEHPVVTHRDGKLLLTTNHETVEYLADDVWKFTFEDKSHERFPEAIELPSEITLEHRHSLNLEYSFLPVDYDIVTELQWKSDHPEIVTVDKNGTLTAVGVGTATITVTATNGTTAACIVTVPIPTYFLIAWLNDGRKDAYMLKEHPKIAYSEGKLLLSTMQQQIEYPAESVHKFTLSDTDNPQDIVPPSTDIYDVEQHDFMKMMHGDVKFTHCRSGSLIKIYSVNGKLLDTVVVDANGEALIHTNDFPIGVYIIQSETITHKIIKR